MKYLLYLLLLLPSVGFSQFEENLTNEEAILSVYELRNASVTIANNYIFSGYGVNYAFKEIDKGFSDLTDSFLRIEVFSKNNPYINSDFFQVKKMIQKSRISFLHTPDKSKFLRIISLLDQFSVLNNQLIQSVKSGLNISMPEQEAAYEIEFCTNQLSILYAMKFMKVQDFNSQTKIDNLLKNIDNQLIILMKSQKNTDDLIFRLQLLQSDIEMFKRALTNKQEKNFLNTIYVLSKKIGNTTRELVKMYS